MMRMRTLAAGALALICGGCLKPDVNRCGNGAICRDDQSCTERDEIRCDEPPRVSACAGLGDYTSCELLGTPSEGSCFSGVCFDCNVDRAGCHFDGWVQMTLPVAYDLRGIYAADATHAWAVGTGGILVFDGTGWAVATAPALHTAEGLESIWGSAATDLYVVSSEGRIFHSDGSAWTEQTGINAPDTLVAISGSSASDVWAVGFSGSVAHRTSAWQIVDPQTLVSFAGVDAHTGTVFGAAGFGTLARNSGGTWTTKAVAAPFNNGSLRDVWAVSATDAWAVGDAVQNDLRPPIFHYDGAAITQAVPIGAFAAVDFNAIWGTSGTNIYAAGTDGTIVHFDGTMWAPISSTTPGRNALKRIHGSAPDDIYVVGDGGALWHYTGR